MAHDSLFSTLIFLGVPCEDQFWKFATNMFGTDVTEENMEESAELAATQYRAGLEPH